MKARKWILAAGAVAAVAAVSGCANDPYYGNNYYANRDYPNARYYGRDYYGRDYYVAPPVASYNGPYERRYWDGRRWLYWDGYRWVS